MLKSLRKIRYLVSADLKQVFLVAIGFVIVSSLEAFGIGIVGPFIYYATNPNEIITGTFSGWFYRYLNFSSSNNFVAALGVLIIIFYLIKSGANWKIQALIFRFSYEQESKLLKKLLHSYFSAPYTYHLSRDSAEIVHTVTGDVKKLSMGVLIPLLTIVANISVITLLSVLLFVSNPSITLIALLSLLPIFLILNFYKDKVRHWGREVSRANESTSRLIYQALGGIKEVKIIGCNDYFEQQVSLNSDRYVKASSENFAFTIAPRMIMEAFFISLIVGFASFILYFQGSAETMISTLGIFALASIRLIPASSNLANSLAVLRGSSYVIDKLNLNLKELYSLTESNKSNKQIASKTNYKSRLNGLPNSLTKDNSKVNKKQSFNQSLIIENVSYKYPAAVDRALCEINLEIIKGESIAFIGKSGAGKSTLMDILLGLLTPQDGDIKLDGVSIYENLRAWQSLIGYIPQSIHLIDASVAENIAFGVPEKDIDYEKVSQCICTAQLESVISALSEGIKTKVGERGVRLSGGQRQRIGIARALYHGSEILIMDEATSALDNETEGLVTEAIKTLSGEKTIFVVAHRLSTIKDCDRVYQLDRGHIIKSGSYSEVVQC